MKSGGKSLAHSPSRSRLQCAAHICRLFHDVLNAKGEARQALPRSSSDSVSFTSTVFSSKGFGFIVQYSMLQRSRSAGRAWGITGGHLNPHLSFIIVHLDVDGHLYLT